MDSEKKDAEKPAAHKPAAKATPFADALKKLKAPKGHETGAHGEDNAKYIRQKQLLEDLADLGL